ncbi:MAG: hypothetical protein GC179_09930 [Anaerolineaceae bacterium]|nr:hypothetical protein [Anaerolineaceae bacterium]
MMNQNRVSLRESLYTVTLLALLALFGTGFLGNITAVQAQSAATCGGQDTDQVQDQNTANDSTEPKCPEDTKAETDTTVCIVLGTASPEATDVNAAGEQPNGQEVQDQTGTEANGQEVQDQAGEGNVANAGNEADQVQNPAYKGSLKVDETLLQTMPDAGRCSALKTMAKITVEAAQAAALKANAGSAVDTIKLDVENGYLVFSVQLKDGRDVKVDAGNGSILATQVADSSN